MKAVEFLLFNIFNGVLFGMLLFLLSSGLTLVFSMMGVLNFAHASFYMLGAYLSWQVGRLGGFWTGLAVAPLLCAGLGLAMERVLLRRAMAQGILAPLLLTFGLVFVIEEAVVLFWGRAPIAYEVPPGLDFPLLTLAGVAFPAYRVFVLVLSCAVLLAIWATLRFTRVGLVLEAALEHPAMTSSLGHDVPRTFSLVFAGGAALAGLGGALAGNLLGTSPAMTHSVGAIMFVVIVVGGLGSLLGALVAALSLGLLQTFAVAFDWSVADLLHGVGLPSPSMLGAPLNRFAPMLPFLAMVLVLLMRPRGLFGMRDL